MTSDPNANVAEYTVSEIASDVKRRIEDAYGYVRVRGEISSYRGRHASGHGYFCLKDAGAKLDAVVWKGVFARLKFKPEEGLEVVATGKLTTYPGKSTYQLVIDQLEPAGAGALMALLEERRKKLAAEGLFDAARKQLLPDLPRVVGVVTSPTGAVIRDILHRIADRFPLRVIVWPVRVQGETSAAEVAAAIRGFNALDPAGPVPRPDVLIVARGGGGLEDLWSFNEEIAVRAAAESAIPLVSAIGHETDTTLIDFAADLRAPTPTAAAERVVPVRADLLDRVAVNGLRLARAASRAVEQKRRDFAGLVRALPQPGALTASQRQQLDIAAHRLPMALSAEVRAKRFKLLSVAARFAPTVLQARIASRRHGFDLLTARADRARTAAEARRRERLAAAAGRLVADLLERPVARRRERLEAAAARAARAHRAGLDRRSDRLRALAGLLGSLSYRSVLERGFALVRGPDGAAVRTASAAPPGARVEIEFADGRVGAALDGRRSRGGGKPRPGQDDLFG
jgi:exodeoxyribonuclease VII large subunit